MGAVARTSVESFKEFKLESGSLSEAIYNVIEAYGENGCIMDDIKDHVDIKENSTISGLIRPLVLMDEVFVAGDTRTARSGKQQQVYRLIRYSTGVASKKEKVARTGFNAGVIYLSKRIKEATSMEEVDAILKEELLKVWRKEKS